MIHKVLVTADVPLGMRPEAALDLPRLVASMRVLYESALISVTGVL